MPSPSWLDERERLWVRIVRSERRVRELESALDYIANGVDNPRAVAAAALVGVRETTITPVRPDLGPGVREEDR